MPHHRQVVGDEQVGQPQALLQVLEQVDHLGPDGDVKGRDRFVGDDEVGLKSECAGDADALALAAAEGVRVAVHGVGRQPDQLQQLGDPVDGRVHAPHLPVDQERLADDVQDPRILGLRLA